MTIENPDRYPVQAIMVTERKLFLFLNFLRQRTLDPHKTNIKACRLKGQIPIKLTRSEIDKSVKRIKKGQGREMTLLLEMNGGRYILSAGFLFDPVDRDLQVRINSPVGIYEEVNRILNESNS